MSAPLLPPAVRRGSRVEIAAAAATRREFLALVGAAGLLVGCGTTGPDGVGTAPGTRTVSNSFGTFEVPVDPQRVIGLEGRRDLETAVALGLGIAAVGSNAVIDGEQASFVPFDVASVPMIEQTEPNLEQIAGLRPDLVLTRGSNITELRDELATLAPLVPVDADGEITWRPDLEQVAATLGREDRLAGPLSDYDARLAAVRDRHADRITTAVIAVVQGGPEEAAFYTSSTSGFYLQAQTLGELGGNHLDFLQTLAETNPDETFSVEQTGALAPADAILLIVNGAEQRAQVEAQPLWQRLPAVTAGRVVITDSRTNYGSVYAAGAALDLLDQLYATLA